MGCWCWQVKQHSACDAAADIMSGSTLIPPKSSMTSLSDRQPTSLNRLSTTAADQHAKQGIVDSIEGTPLQDK